MSILSKMLGKGWLEDAKRQLIEELRPVIAKLVREIAQEELGKLLEKVKLP